MTDHRIVIIRFHKSKHDINPYYISFSAEEPGVECDDLWRMVAKYIGDQDSDPMHSTLFGILEDVVLITCDVPLSDRMNGIQFCPISFPDGEWMSANPMYPFVQDQSPPVGHQFAKHHLIPRHE